MNRPYGIRTRAATLRERARASRRIVPFTLLDADSFRSGTERAQIAQWDCAHPGWSAHILGRSVARGPWPASRVVALVFELPPVFVESFERARPPNAIGGHSGHLDRRLPLS
jgi:hypothetical protein